MSNSGMEYLGLITWVLFSPWLKLCPSMNGSEVFETKERVEGVENTFKKVFKKQSLWTEFF